MSKRTLLNSLAGLLVVSLPFLGGGWGRPAQAETANLDPASEPGWTGIPSLRSDDAKFLLVQGGNNQSLAGTAGGRGRLILRFSFPAGVDAKVAIFDGDTEGLWDQRHGSVLLPDPYDTEYLIYPDPTGSVARARVDNLTPVDGDGNPVAPVLVARASQAPFAGTDAQWCMLFERADDDPLHVSQGAYNPENDCDHYTIEVILKPLPGINPRTGKAYELTGREVNGFKVAFTGGYLVPSDGTLGFIGGVVDSLTIGEQEVSEDPLPDGEENVYDGIFEFPFESAHICGSELQKITVFDADADWNPPIVGQDSSPLGIPPDDGGRYRKEDGTFTDNSAYTVSPSILWEFLPEGGAVVYSSNTHAPINPLSGQRHASINEAIQPGPHAPYQATDLDAQPFRDTPGRWIWRWRGVDARNAVFVRVTADFGTTTPAARGRVFCDTNANGIFDAGDVPLSGVAVRLRQVIGGVASDPTILLTTNADGRWFSKLAEATWEIDLPGFLGGTPGVALPGRFVQNCGDTDFDIPVECGAPLTGRVFCDFDLDGVFGGLDDPFEGVTVRIVNETTLAVVATPVTGPDGIYHAVVDPGLYTISVDPAQPALGGALPLAPNPPIHTGVLVVGGDALTIPQDFTFDCRAQVSGKVYRENRPCDGVNQPDEAGIPGIRVLLERIDPGTGFPVPGSERQAFTNALGNYAFSNVEPGRYRLRVADGQATLLTLDPSTSTTLTVDVLPSTPSTGNDFGYCPRVGRIGGIVWREANGRSCDGERQADETPIAGVLVTLVPEIPVGPLQTRTTGPDGRFEFLDLPEGQYRLEVGPQPALVGLFPSTPTIFTVVLPAGGDEEREFGFCPDASILVRVFRNARGEDCNETIETGDRPVPGVLVALDGVNPVRPPQVGITGLDGEVLFTGLPEGTWRVSVAGNQPALIVLTPAAPGSTERLVAVLPGEHVEVPSAWCEEICTIAGFVVRDPDCFAPWNDRGAGLAGVLVELHRAAGGLVATTLTDPAGMFSFGEVAADAYVVRLLPQPVLLGLTPTSPTDVAVGVEDCPASVSFTLGTAGIDGKVLLDVDCDGVVDEARAGVLVRLERLDPPGAGTVFDVLTGPDGRYVFPTAAQAGLLPGRYRVSVPPQPATATWVASGPTEVVLTLEVCLPARVDFVFCGSGGIVGTVVRETVDCDGVRQPGEPGIPGVQVTLFPVSPAGNPRVAVTNAGGSFAFSNLPGGQYQVVVDGGQPVLVGLSPSSDVNVGVTVLPPGDQQVDFFFCPLSRIVGRVFRQPPGDCDERFDAGLDVPLPGVAVLLTASDGAVQVALTNVFGRFVFPDLPSGEYVVSVDGAQPQIVNLSAATPRSVGPFHLPPDTTEQVDFALCQQVILGTVFREQEGADCDGVFDRDRDVGIGGVTVSLLKLDAPQQGLARNVVTRFDGSYLFQDIPAGLYEIRVPGGQPQLVGLAPSSAEFLQPVLLPGAIVRDQDFGYCPESKPGRICGLVFKEPEPDCDGVFTFGTDIRLEGVEVVLEDALTGQVVARTFTGQTAVLAQGQYCFLDVPAGSYFVRVADGQPILVNLVPSTPAIVPVELLSGENRDDVDFGFCEKCPCEPCCEGDLHEVEVETEIWVGDCFGMLDVEARLLASCDRTAPAVDEVTAFFRGQFDDPRTGPNDVLTIQNIRLRPDGFAAVRLRITAQGAMFPLQHFGNTARRVEVEINGRLVHGCATFRCESFRPGMRFTWTQDCGLPPCDGFVAVPPIEDVPCGDGCEGRFIVSSTTSLPCFCACNPDQCIECRCPAPCGTCKGGIVELTLRYEGTVAGARVQVFGKGNEFDGVVQPGQDFTFRGTESDGRMGSNIELYVNGQKHTEIHTSCSRPIGVGDRHGSFVIMGGASREGGRLCGEEPDGVPTCPDCPEPCEKCEGGVIELTLRYDGPTRARIQAGKDPSKPGGFLGDLDPGQTFTITGAKPGEKISDAAEISVNGVKNVAIHVSCSQPIGPGTVWGSFTVVKGRSKKTGALICDTTTTSSCKCDGRVTTLTLQYGGATTARVRVDGKAGTVFDQDVAPGGVFTFTGNDKDGTLGTETVIYVNGTQHVAIHTSCSKPIGTEMVFGSFTILEGASLKGGPLCPLPGGTQTK